MGEFVHNLFRQTDIVLSICATQKNIYFVTRHTSHR